MKSHKINSQEDRPKYIIDFTNNSITNDNLQVLQEEENECMKNSLNQFYMSMNSKYAFDANFTSIFVNQATRYFYILIA